MQGTVAGKSEHDHAAHARWLIHEADYGVATAQSTMKEGFPFGNVMSMSDGPDDQATGRILFYVTTISRFAQDVAQDDRVSLTVSQEQAEGGRGCDQVDPEWPTCARVRRTPALSLILFLFSLFLPQGEYFVGTLPRVSTVTVLKHSRPQEYSPRWRKKKAAFPQKRAKINAV
jgi:hypothetical protein